MIATKVEKAFVNFKKSMEAQGYLEDPDTDEGESGFTTKEARTGTINRHKKSLKNIEDKSIYITKDNNTLFLNIPNGRARVSDILDVVINEMGSSRERFIKHFLSGDR